VRKRVRLEPWWVRDAKSFTRQWEFPISNMEERPVPRRNALFFFEGAIGMSLATSPMMYQPHGEQTQLDFASGTSSPTTTTKTSAATGTTEPTSSATPLGSTQQDYLDMQAAIRQPSRTMRFELSRDESRLQQ
jgi:hypothetical protein